MIEDLYAESEQMNDEDIPEKIAAFTSDDVLIGTALRMFAARRAAIDPRHHNGSKAQMRAIVERWHACWHESLALTESPDVTLGAEIRKNDLSDAEAELLVALVANQLGLTGEDHVRQCKRLIAFVGAELHGGLRYLRSLSEDGELHRKKILIYGGLDDDLPDRELVIDPNLVERVLVGNRPGRVRYGWPVASEDELHKYLAVLTAELRRRSNIIRHPHGMGMAPLIAANQKVRRMYISFHDTVREHPDWKINGIYETPDLVHLDEYLILPALVGRELGHLPADDELFTGAGLIRAICEFPENFDFKRRCLRPESCLLKDALIQPAAGMAAQIGDGDDFMEMEFELTQKSREMLGIQRRLVKSRNGVFHVRAPQVPMERLVLPESTCSELNMAIAQVHHAGTMLNDWGLKEIFPYGNGVTLLFWGPPGTGKTACAEALAHELQVPILTADYSQILNCFVGNTEKAITRIFNDARAHGALLFWDEADAMFYNRDMAQRTYEIQFANVLLTELERFEGVCVLATNRKVALDPALERRISLKIEFNRPSREERRAIWRKLLPEKLPLAEDVDLRTLAEVDLSGGEIKNAILNAIRMALHERGAGPITSHDLQKATRLEQDRKSRNASRGTMGFTC